MSLPNPAAQFGLVLAARRAIRREQEPLLRDADERLRAAEEEYERLTTAFRTYRARRYNSGRRAPF